MDDREVIVTEKRLRSICLYVTEEENDAGSTLASCPRGPNDGVHFSVEGDEYVPQTSTEVDVLQGSRRPSHKVWD
jgi:hypothetical protein